MKAQRKDHLFLVSVVNRAQVKHNLCRHGGAEEGSFVLGFSAE